MKFAMACALIFGLAHLAAGENLLESQFRQEGDALDQDCIHPPAFSFGSIGGCAQTLFTGAPLHIAVGSLPPGNGFGAGLAFTTHYTPNEDWRLYLDIDAVGTPNGSWRTGAYLTAAFTRRPAIVPRPGGSTSKAPVILEDEMPTFHAYAQSISLNTVDYYGLGQGTPRNESFFGLRETIVGGNAIVPVFKPLNVSVFAELNGRFTALRPDNGSSGQSVQENYNDATAPGLTAQPAYAQFGEGVRARPRFLYGHVQLDYSLALQEWIASQSNFSFRRFTADFNHTFPLYSAMRSAQPEAFNGPDSCLADPNAKKCPSISRNLEGSFGFRVLYTASYVPAGNVVPFYFDPTLGGTDIDGNVLLPSYPDYRFRAPNLLLVRGSFEHSIYKWPVGVKFLVDEGRVGLTPGDLGFNHLAHSFAAGLTLHAGGLPLVDLLFAWGGHEGTHTIAEVSNTLLGGSSRPSLY